MGNTIQRLMVRVKKSIIFIVITPILLGLLGWLIPVAEEPVIYQSQAKILLGEYNHSKLNDPKHLQILLTHELFYKERLNDWWENHKDKIKDDFQVSSLAEGVIVLSYRDQSSENAERFVNDVIEEFLLLDETVVNEKKKVIEAAINSMMNLEEDTVEKQKLLYELNTELLSVREAKILNNTDIRSQTTKAIDSIERGFVGVLIGITFSWIWVVVPVLFLRK